MSKRGNPNCTVDEQYTFLDEVEILNFILFSKLFNVATYNVNNKAWDTS